MKSMIAAVAALAGIASVANAALVYSTDFNAPTYSAGALVGQDGWLQTGTVVTNPLQVGGGAVAMTTGQDANRPFAGVNTDSIFLSATFTLTTASAAGDYFIHLGDGGASNFNARIYAKSSGSGFVMAMGTSSGSPVTYGTTELSFNTPITLVARYDFVAGALNDTGALFINPANAYGIGDTAYVAATTIGVDATTISSVNLRQGSASNAPAVSVDALSVYTIPTPGSVALLGLAGLVAGRRRRA